jgi:predicted ATP-grasp superfamily ATP-dependent carboligase
MQRTDRVLRGAGVLILGDHRQSLAVARSLHCAGYRPIAGRAGGRTILESSRCVAERWNHPPLSEPRAWADALEAFCKKRTDVGAVFPVGDAEIELALPLAATLPVLTVAVPPAIFAACRSKRAILALAEKTGVPTEAWEAVDQPEALWPALLRVGLPAALKPDLAEQHAVGFKAAILCSEADTRRLAARTAFSACGFVLQRLASGMRHNVYFVAREGRLLGHAEVRILRTDRADGTGLAVEGVSVPPNPALTAWTTALAARLSYTGAGCAQFVVDERSGKACFLEINARLGANCAAVCACGLDLPRLFVEALLGVAREQPPAKIGRRYAWLGGDLSGLALALHSGRVTWRQAAAWLARAALAQLHAHDHVTWSRRDPLPTLMFYVRLLRAVFGMIRRRLFPSRAKELSHVRVRAGQEH